jgi:peptidoglycan/LPS O-acetylase OafA/YrhL
MTADEKEGRLFVLDGWRGISILLVLATHLLPLGPKKWQLNIASGYMGMSLFFTLSGFLITRQLYAKRNVAAFFVRRLFRIVPLAWVYSAVALLICGGGAREWASHLLFWGNNNAGTTELTPHFWSLCVEVQFYVGIGLLMAVTRFRGFWLLPVVWVALLVYRFWNAPMGSVGTLLRVDEILAGACLALVSLGFFGPSVKAFVARLPFPLLLVGLLAASLPAAGFFDTFRGPMASLVVGHTLFSADGRRFRWLGHPRLRYVAEVSYALYVIHPLTLYGWLGSGPLMVKYAKRLISLTLTFTGAHLSTFYFERPLLELGKRIAARIERRAAAAAAPAIAAAPP